MPFSLQDLLNYLKVDKSQVRVINYARFSSRKQGKGTSIARQVDRSKEWCEKHGLTLDDDQIFKDEGVSAFSGKNASSGALAKLQAMLATGEILPGTVLLVEAFDRLTRRDIQQGTALMMSLLTAGLVIVTLIDDKIWTQELMRDLPSFMLSLITIYRGHEESKTKSDRLQKTFRKHRREGSQQAFGTGPGWLNRKSKYDPWEIDEEKAAVVRRVFKLSAAGFGSKAIALKANDEKWPVPVRLNLTEGRWHAAMAGRILRNAAVIGEHQHRLTSYEAREDYWRGKEIGDPIKGYYPPIISDELWLAARASISLRSVAKRRDSHYFNVFSGLLYCGCCGAPIQRKNETTGFSRAQLNCADRLAGLTKCSTMSAKNFDGPILQAIYEHSHEVFADEGARRQGDEIAALEAAIQEKQKQADNVADAIATAGGRQNPALSKKSFRLQDEIDELELRLIKLKEDEVVKEVGVFDETFVQDTLGYLYVSGDDEAREKRAKLNLRLSRIVDTIWVFGYDCAFIKFKNNELTHVVPLPAKKLPSRANPAAKNHVTPKEWVEPPKPIWIRHQSECVTLPEPRRPKPVGWRTTTLAVPVADDEVDAISLVTNAA
jgi:DNA invertase Pin-like site-specific DNA recombinase